MMLCPKCQAEMEKGRLEVHGSATGFALVGFSMQDLYWYDEERSRDSRRKLLKTIDPNVAFACKPCGTIAFDTPGLAEPARPAGWAAGIAKLRGKNTETR